MMQRAMRAARFYHEEYKRESAKELALLRAMRSPKKVAAYMGWVGHDNLGDEILYEAHQALFSNTTLVPFRKSGLAHALSSVRKRPVYRAGILGGGTLINQSDSWLHQIADLLRFDVPLFCLGTGVTESAFRAAHEMTNMEEWVATLRQFAFVGVRGPYSLKALQDAGYDQAILTGDTALALAPAAYTKRPGNKVIGLNYGLVKENQIWGETNAYTVNIAAAIKQCIALGYEVRLLPVWDKDIPSNQALLELVGNPACQLIVCHQSLAAYREQLDACDMFIGQKLHATIMACMERIPSIMIEYQPKCRDFMASVDMEHLIIKTSDCTPSALLAMLREVEHTSEHIQQTLDARVRHYRALQYRLAKQIEQTIIR